MATTEKLPKQFILVKGRNTEMNSAAEDAVKKLGIDYTSLQTDSDAGADMLSDFSAYKDSYALVVLGDDEVGTLRDNFPKNATLRAETWICFMMGYLVARLGRDHVFAIHRKVSNYQVPYEFDSLLYYPYDEEGRWQFDLVKCLKNAGYEVDANKLL